MPKEKKEIRMADVAVNDSTPELMIIDGRAITFNSPTLIYEYDGIKYYEVIDAGALDQCDMSDVVLRYNHTEHMFIMARTRKGSLRLIKDELGLSLSATLFNITQARDLYTLIKEGAIDKMSFAFTVAEDSYNSETRTRTILKIKKLYDVAAVDTPAYDDTELSARSFFEVESEKERKLADADELRKKKLILLLELNGI
jgi:HK97 family phage prohead protease